jgi:hypothetical protein
MTTLVGLPVREAHNAAITTICDRCGRRVVGTGGFYYVGSGYWSLYAQPHEVNVCSACMWADAGFRHDYLISPFGSQEARDRRLGIDRDHPIRGSRHG